MEPEHLDENVSAAREKMRAQTGKETGGPTGLCHLVVTSALGADVDFTVDVTRDSQIKIESESGLSPYPVIVDRGVLSFDAITKLLEQNQVPFEALLITGRVQNQDAAHMVAVVPDRATGQYAIVDSLLPEAVERRPDSEQVANHVNSRFNTVTESLTYSVVLTQAERDRRLAAPGHKPVMIDRGIHI